MGEAARRHATTAGRAAALLSLLLQLPACAGGIADCGLEFFSSASGMIPSCPPLSLSPSAPSSVNCNWTCSPGYTRPLTASKTFTCNRGSCTPSYDCVVDDESTVLLCGQSFSCGPSGGVCGCHAATPVTRVPCRGALATVCEGQYCADLGAGYNCAGGGTEDCLTADCWLATPPDPACTGCPSLLPSGCTLYNASVATCPCATGTFSAPSGVSTISCDPETGWNTAFACFSCADAVPSGCTLVNAVTATCPCPAGSFSTTGLANIYCGASTGWSVPKCTACNSVTPAGCASAVTLSPSQVSCACAANTWSGDGTYTLTCDAVGGWTMAGSCTDCFGTLPLACTSGLAPTVGRCPCAGGSWSADGKYGVKCVAAGGWGPVAGDLCATCAATLPSSACSLAPGGVSASCPCPAGTFSSTGSADYTCSASGGWTAAAGSCPNSCAATVPSGCSLAAGSVTSATCSCQPGLYGTSAATCNPGGWTAASGCAGTCVLPAVGLGVAQTPSGTPPASVVYSCANGYYYASGSASRSCSSVDGSWSGAPFSCARCTLPSVPAWMTLAVATVSSDGEAAPVSVTVSCGPGYLPDSTVQFCSSSTGTWTGPLPSCVEVPSTTASPSRSTSASPSRSTSASPSRSTSASPSCSVSASPSRSTTASPSRSTTASPSRSTTASPSRSTSASPSRSTSASPSSSTESTSSVSSTSSITPSGSTTSTGSVSPTPSVSLTPSGSPTSSSSGSTTLGASSSSSASFSATPSGSVTASGTRSSSTSGSPSSTSSGSAAPTNSATASASTSRAAAASSSSSAFSGVSTQPGSASPVAASSSAETMSLTAAAAYSSPGAAFSPSAVAAASSSPGAASAAAAAASDTARGASTTPAPDSPLASPSQLAAAASTSALLSSSPLPPQPPPPPSGVPTQMSVQVDPVAPHAGSCLHLQVQSLALLNTSAGALPWLLVEGADGYSATLPPPPSPLCANAASQPAVRLVAGELLPPATLVLELVASAASTDAVTAAAAGLACTVESSSAPGGDAGLPLPVPACPPALQLKLSTPLVSLRSASSALAVLQVAPSNHPWWGSAASGVCGATLRCSLALPGASVAARATLRVPLLLLAPRWPILADIVADVAGDDAAGRRYKSAWGDWMPAPLPAPADDDEQSIAAAAVAVAASSAQDTAAASPSSPRVFSLVTAGATNLTLIASPLGLAGNASFGGVAVDGGGLAAPALQVTLDATDWWGTTRFPLPLRRVVLKDGSVVSRLTLPPLATVCDPARSATAGRSTARACPALRLTLSTFGVPRSHIDISHKPQNTMAASDAAALNVTLPLGHGVSVACGGGAPFCPGDGWRLLGPRSTVALVSGGGGAGAATTARRALAGTATSAAPPSPFNLTTVAVAAPPPAVALPALPLEDREAVAAAMAALAGIRYVEPCAATGRFLDPTVTTACTNASDPRRAQCAWGSGDTCTPCPPGALCPGGYALVPLPGYWLPSISASPPEALLRCAAPATLRCPGGVSSASSDAARCGFGYREGSVGCGGCALGFYPASKSGVCEACPVEEGAWDRLRPVAVLIGWLTAGCLPLAALVLWMHARRGGTLRGGIARALLFVQSTVLALQVLVQTQTASPDLFPPLADVWSALQVLQYQGVVPHPSCRDQGGSTSMTVDAAVSSMVATLVISIGLLPVLQAVVACQPRAKDAHGAADSAALGSSSSSTLRLLCCHFWKLLAGSSKAGLLVTFSPGRTVRRSGLCRCTGQAPLRRYAVAALPLALRLATTAAFLLYGRTLAIAYGLQRCTSIQLPVSAYVELSGVDGTALAAAGYDAGGASSNPADWRACLALDAATPGTVQASAPACRPFVRLRDEPVSVAVLAAEPFTACWEGTHTSAAQLGQATIAVYGIAFPLVLILGAYAAMRRVAATASGEGGKAGAAPALRCCKRRRKGLTAAGVMKEWRGSASLSQPLSPSAAFDASVKAAAPPTTRFFWGGSMRPAAVPFMLLELAVVHVFAAFQGMAPARSTAEAVARLGTSLGLLTLSTLAVARYRPYASPVQNLVAATVNVLAVLATALLYTVQLQHVATLEEGSAAGRFASPIAGLSVAVFVGMVVTGAVILGAFYRNLWQGARQEQESIDAREREASRRNGSTSNGVQTSATAAAAAPSEAGNTAARAVATAPVVAVAAAAAGNRGSVVFGAQSPLLAAGVRGSGGERRARLFDAGKAGLGGPASSASARALVHKPDGEERASFGVVPTLRRQGSRQRNSRQSSVRVSSGVPGGASDSSGGGTLESLPGMAASGPSSRLLRVMGAPAVTPPSQAPTK